MAEMGKIAVNTWDFRGKKQIIGTEKTANWQPNRKAKWCKMQTKYPKMDKRRNAQDRFLHQITCKLPPICARSGCSDRSVL